MSGINTSDVLDVVKRLMPDLVECHNKMVRSEPEMNETAACALLVMYGAFMELVQKQPSTPEFTPEGQDTTERLISAIAVALDTKEPIPSPTQPLGRA